MQDDPIKMQDDPINPQSNSSNTNNDSDSFYGSVDFYSSGNPQDFNFIVHRFRCESCGYVYEGPKEINTCPRCRSDQLDDREDCQM